MTTLLTAGDIIDRSAQFYRLHLGKVLRVTVWSLAAGLAAGVAENLLLWLGQTDTLIGKIVLLLTGLPVMAVSVFVTLLLTRAMVREIKGAERCPAATWRDAARSFWPMAATLILVTALIFLGGMAFLVPGVIFWTWFAFAPVAVATGDAGVKKSFGLSRELVAGKFFSVLWRLAAPMIFFFLLQLVMLLLTTLLLQGAVRGVWSIEILVAGAPLWFLLLLSLIMEVIRTAVLPLFVFSATMLYLALSDAKPEPTKPEQV
ncbi:hypothetical protein EPN90_05025 [Patescibacteria group bacterium]|nr:MAG: hypothetical protein EPN90_05025 [Patescibacteria group bacterium]